MSKFRRQLMMASMGEPVPPTPVLPYDAEVEWIKGGVFQTSFVPSGNSVHTWKYMHLQNLDYSYVFGVTPVESGKWMVFGGFNNTNTGTQILYGNSSKYYKNISLNTIYTGEANFSGSSKILKLNNSTVITLSASTITNTYTLKIQLSKNGNIDWQLWWYKCGSDLDIIPVRVGQEGCLYDKVSGTLIHNTDTNVIPIFGNDVT